MPIDWNLAANVTVPVATLLIGAWVERLFAERPKVISYLAHASAITVRPPNGTSFIVHTHTIVLRNGGRRPAVQLRVGHAHFPNFSVYPDVAYEVVALPGGGKELVFPSLGPKEQVTISYLYYPPETWQNINTHVKSDEGPARFLTVLPTAQLSPWMLLAIRGVLLVGCATILYLLIRLITWLAVGRGG